MRGTNWASRGLTVLGLVAVGAASAGAADPTATLAAKGLTRSGKVYIVASEAAVLNRWRETRATVAASVQMGERQARETDTATRLTDLEEERLDGQNRLAELNQQILEQTLAQSGTNRSGFGGGGGGGGMGGGTPGGNSGVMGFGGAGWNAGNSALQMEREQVRQDLSALAEEQKQLRTNAVPLRERGELDDLSKKKAEQARKNLDAMRDAIKEMDSTYAKLATDPEVKQSLAEYARTNHLIVKLGPSEAYVTMVRAVRQAERKMGDEPLTPVPSSNRKAKKSKSRR